MCPVHFAHALSVIHPKAHLSDLSFRLPLLASCVYPDRPSGLAAVLLDLLSLNPKATLLLAFEQRPPPASAPDGVDYTRDFFDEMRAGCRVERVPDDELDPKWMCDEITLWRMHARVAYVDGGRERR